MTYWGTTYWPSRLSSRKVSIRKVINTISSSNNISFKSKLTNIQAESSNGSSLQLNKDITEQVETKIITSEKALAVTPLDTISLVIRSKGMSSVASKISKGRSVAHAIGKKQTSFNNKDTVGKSTICVRIEGKSNIYYWTCFEKVSEDDNLTELIKDCRGE